MDLKTIWVSQLQVFYSWLADLGASVDAIEAPPIDPRDAFMLESSAGASTAMVNGANVSWLRKTEYISRESTAARPNATQNHDL